MKHPFASDDANYLSTSQTTLVNGGGFSLTPAPEVFLGPQDGKASDPRFAVIKPAKPVSPPVFYTQAIGEDGGGLPDPGLL